MKAKTFEVRDEGTFIPVLAVKLDPTAEIDRYLLARAGYGRTPEEQSRYVQLIKLAGGGQSSQCDPFGWRSRTMSVAHQYLVDHFDELQTGAVVDVRFILRETGAPAPSEAHL